MKYDINRELLCLDELEKAVRRTHRIVLDEFELLENPRLSESMREDKRKFVEAEIDALRIRIHELLDVD